MTERKTARQRDDAGTLKLGSWFDRLSDFRKDLVCAGFLLGVVYILFWNIIVSDMDLAASSGDTVAHFSWISALDHIREAEGVDALWMPYLYGGMPVFSALLFPKAVNYLETGLIYLAKLAFFFSGTHYFILHVFLSGLFMYILARGLKLPHLGALVGAVAVMLNPYAIGLGESFHWSKLAVFSYIPIVFFLTHRLIEKRDIFTLGLLSAAIGTMFLNRHPQMAFYGMLLAGGYFAWEFAAGVKTGTKQVVVAGLLLAAAIGLGMALYAYELLPTKEYADYSVRGGGSAGAAGGANYEWATNWSFHPLETINYIIPSWFGFGSNVGVQWQGQQIRFPGYWGWMPFTDNPPYIGIVPIILAGFALAYRRTRLTWFLVGISLLVLFISFGKHLSIVYDLFFYYFPFFNKFRAPSMILFLIPVTVGLLAVQGLAWIYDAVSQGGWGARKGEGRGEGKAAGRKNPLMKWIVVFLAIGVLGLIGGDILFGMFPASSFRHDADQIQPDQIQVVREIRFDLLRKDLIRISVIGIVTLGLISAHFRRKIRASALGIGLVLVLTADLAAMAVMFINPKPKTDLAAALKPDETLELIQSDKGTFRVFSLEQRYYRDNSLMNAHLASVTGYSPAKLKNYQEMIDSALLHQVDPDLPVNMNVLNMMNTKYIISPGVLQREKFSQVSFNPETKLFVYRNFYTMPRAWIVDSVAVAPSKSERYAIMNSREWDPQRLAILDEAPLESVSRPDSARVRLVKHGAHRIEIEASTNRRALLVLSEVYYPAGWIATVDGAETKIYQANAVLRAIVVPEGKHKVEFVFDPATYREGDAITLTGWGIVGILLLAGGYRTYSSRSRPPQQG